MSPKSAMIALACLTAVAAPALAQQDGRLIDQGFEDASPLATSLKLAPVDMRVPTGFDRVYEVKIPLGPGGSGGTQTVYVRSSGGLSAVFPRSVYTPTAGGLIPELPPGTVFHIGSQQFQPAQAIAPREYAPNQLPSQRIGTAIPQAGRQILAAPLMRLNLAAGPSQQTQPNPALPNPTAMSPDGRVPGEPTAIRPSQPPETPRVDAGTPLGTVFAGEAVRRERVAVLLRRARAADSRNPAPRR